MLKQQYAYYYYYPCSLFPSETDISSPNSQVFGLAGLRALERPAPSSGEATGIKTQTVKSLWNYLETSPSETQSTGKAASGTTDPDLQITSWSFSLMDVFKRNNGTLGAARRDNHRHRQGACICAEEGRREPLTFLENSWVVILQLDATYASCTFA